MFTAKLLNVMKPTPELLSEFSYKTIQNACKRAHKELRMTFDLPCKATRERLMDELMGFVYEGDKLRKTYSIVNGVIKVVNHS